MDKQQWLNSTLAGLVATGLTTATCASDAPKSADEIAKELSNPATAMASMELNIQYKTYDGDLPDADDQDNWSLLFQPVLPFPVGDTGNNIIFRPAIPVTFDQPIFKANEGSFDEADTAVGDITFDLAYAGTEITDKKTKSGYIWGFGVAGTLPTATDSDQAGKQWRLGPEYLGGIIRDWGLVGAVISNRWNVGGWDDTSYSMMTMQYFYAITLGEGLQVYSNPVVTYDWHADSDEALTLPLGIGLSKTTAIDGRPWKFAVQLHYFAEQPDAFGPDWMLKFTITPVVKNKLADWFK